MFEAGPLFLGSLCFLSMMGLRKISLCLLEAFHGPEHSKCHVEKIGCIFKATCVPICHSSTMWPLKALLVSLSSIRDLPSGQSLIISQSPKLANVLGEGRGNSWRASLHFTAAGALRCHNLLLPPRRENFLGL